MPKVSLIILSFDNWMYGSNPWNCDFDDLNFDDDEMFIAKGWIYRINYDILERLNNSLIVDVYTNWM